MNPPTLIIIRGLPGSGKTTAARLLATIPGAVDVSADEFPGRYFYDEMGELAFDFRDPKRALDWCREQVRQHILNRVPVIIVHNTFISRRSVQDYAELASAFGYRLIVLKAEGRFRSIHAVPDDVLEAMFRSYEPWDQDNGKEENKEQGSNAQTDGLDTNPTGR